MPEFGFYNIPDQLKGTEITAYQPFLNNPDRSCAVSLSPAYYPYTYDCLRKYSGRILSIQASLNEGLEPHVMYHITLSWYGWSHTYYVKFDFAPALIITGGQYP